MKLPVRLTPTNTSQAVDVPFATANIVVQNFTGSPVYLRIGARDIPSAINADIIVPAAVAQSFPIVGHDFGVALGNPSLLSTTPSLSGLSSVCNIVFLDASEEVPSYGSANFLSLSMSDLTTGDIIYNNAFNSATFDLGTWGGAIIYMNPAANSGQAILTVQVSDDATVWNTLGAWAVWPAIPAVLLIPRTLRFMRILLSVTGIAGEPSLGGTYAVRATIAEITQVSYSPVTSSISRAYNVPNLSQTDIVLCTTNLEALSIGINNTSGTRAEMIVWAGSQATVGGAWRLVSFREQSVAGSLYNSIYRSTGDLDLFTKVSILDIAGGGVVGTFVASIRRATDTSGMLQSIYAALGDVGQPVNANQSIYHVLVNSKTDLDGIKADTTTQISYLASIDQSEGGVGGVRANTASIDTKMTTLHNDLVNVHSDLGLAGQLHVDLTGTIHGDLLTIDTHVDGLETLAGSGNASLASIDGKLTTISSNIASLLTVLSNYYGARKDTSFYYTATVLCTAAGVYSNDPVDVWSTRANGYLTQVNAAYVGTSGGFVFGLPAVVHLAYGTNGAATFEYYRQVIGPNHTTTDFHQQATLKAMDGNLRSGTLIPAGQTRNWVMVENCSNVLIMFEVWYRNAAP